MNFVGVQGPYEWHSFLKRVQVRPFASGGHSLLLPGGTLPIRSDQRFPSGGS